MSNNRNIGPQTLQARFGFQDSDLTSARHDAIMMWLDQTMPGVLLQVCGAPTGPALVRERDEALQRCVYEYLRYRDDAAKVQYITDARTHKIPAAPIPVIRSKVWEYAIVSKTGYTIGFVDMRVQAEIAYLDYTATGLPHWSMYPTYISFEVKSTIPSAGELLRQIRLYQAHLQDMFVVVSPDDRFKDILRQQGVRFVQCPE